MGIAVALIVVQMRGANLRTQFCEHSRHSVAQMGMASIKADTDIVEVADVENFQEIARLRDLVLDIFHQQLDAQWIGKSAQVFERCQRIFERAWVPAIFTLAKMND